MAQDDRDLEELQATIGRVFAGVGQRLPRVPRSSDPVSRAPTEPAAAEPSAGAAVDPAAAEPQGTEEEPQRTDEEPERTEEPAEWSEAWIEQKRAEAAEYRQTAVRAVHKAGASLKAASKALEQIDVPGVEEGNDFLRLARDRHSSPEGKQRFVDAASALKAAVLRGQENIKPAVTHLNDALGAIEEARVAAESHDRAPLNTSFAFNDDELERLRDDVNQQLQLVSGAMGNLGNGASYLDEFVLADNASGTGEDLWHTARTSVSAPGLLDSAKSQLDRTSIDRVTRLRPEPAQTAETAQGAVDSEQDLRLRTSGSATARRGHHTGR
ncbi:hypothetical protein AB0F43_15510 [Kribbella sp. NPDC023972]|uniref:hypothetical protein n=1 Tax=Kribbella sp. NPDC023972 TaxID=3154795 RepID=UPI0033C3ECB0